MAKIVQSVTVQKNRGIALLFLLLSAASVFSSCSGNQPQTRRVIAVQLAETEAHDSNFAGQLQQAVINGLMENKSSKKFIIVDNSYKDRIATQHLFEASEWSDARKVAELDRELNADTIAVTSLNSSTGGVEVSVTLMDVNTMEVMGKTAVITKGISSAGTFDTRAVASAVKKMKLNI